MTPSVTIYTGQISYLPLGKGHGYIEYTDTGETKSILFLRNLKEQLQLKQQNKIPELHKFRSGDIVSFQIRQSEKDPDTFIACNLIFKSNDSFSSIIEKANKGFIFKGYLKKVGDALYIKELDTYTFFPVLFSRWEKEPAQEELNILVAFKLVNLHKPFKIAASLVHKEYTPEYLLLKEYWENDIPFDAVVRYSNPYFVKVFLLNELCEGRIKHDPGNENQSFQPGDIIKVKVDNIGEKVVEVSIL